jgi:phosphatidylglycerol:prolipoprotein diacylglycerol transferase
MYPNLYYVFKDWFGVHWKALSFLNTFGLMVAIAFIIAAVVLTSELKRKEKQGLLLPREESITVGKPASLFELLLNFFTGFIFAYKLFGLFINKPDDVTAQDYIFSRDGNIIAGLAIGILLAFLKWKDANKQKLKEPEQRVVRIWPHDRVGDIIVLGLVFGILGAKLFDGFENWDDFIQHPIERIFSASGLTFYGGLIVATIAICWYGHKRGIKLVHLIDSAAPALLIAYAIGRIGCQVSGDGDWGIYNSAYITDPATAKVVEATPQDFQQQVQKYNTYFLSSDSTTLADDDRKSSSFATIPNKAFRAPSFLPRWMVAYNFPQNVNKDGIIIPGCEDEHNRVLPVPVYPTSFYETVTCTLLFLFLWSIRKRVKVPGVIFGIYLILNGLERFTIEKIRVNNKYHIFGINPTQAEIISSLLVLAGLLLIIFQSRKTRATTN